MTEPITTPLPGDASPININVTNPPPGQQYFTVEQLEQARQQEKDKVYDRLKKQDDQLKAFTSELEGFRTKEAQRETDLKAEQQKAADAARAAEQEKLSATELITAKQKEWEEAQAQLRSDLESQQALLRKEQQFLALQSFTQRRMAEEIASDTIAEEFLDYITGDNEEEVEASITKAKEKSARIAASIGQGTGPSPLRPAGVSPTGFGPSGPLDNLTGTKEYSQTDLDNMGMSEYAKFRVQTGIAKAGKDQGLFR